MISPRIDKLLEHVDSNYASVIVSAKRADKHLVAREVLDVVERLRLVLSSG
ncbi:MAG: hypothetical protein NVS1B9_10020 [Solirubrobacteraceae bacterium]